jgi:biotin operon repressor
VNVFGSQARAKVLGYLANSDTPQTGYAISKSVEISFSKVFEELKRLESAGILVKTLDSRGRSQFALRDPELRSSLSKRIRIISAEEWFSPDKVARRRKALVDAKGISVSLPRVPSGTGWSSRLAAEFHCAPEKDRALKRVRRASSRDRLR